MPEKNLSVPVRSAAGSTQFSANEKAILDSQRNPVLRALFTQVWRIKLRLQFSGWMQYIPFALLTLAFFLLAGLSFLLGSIRAATPLFLFGIVLLVVLAFDLTTVKFRLRPRERLPRRNDDLGTFDLMRARRSCRSFQTRKLTAGDHHELMERVRFHSGEATIGKSPVRFEYVAAPLTVWPTVNASEFLVAIAPRQYDRTAVIDVGRTLQKIVIDATRMGLGTCWIGPGADHASIRQHLGARFNAEKDHIICVCAVGYRSGFIPVFLRVFNAHLHRRLPLSDLFFADAQFKEPLPVEEPPFNRFGRTYEVCQWAPSSYNGQTTRCVAVMQPGRIGKDKPGPHLTRFDFYATTASRYYAAVAVGIWCANWEMGCEVLGQKGHLAILSPEERGTQAEQDQLQLPRYDVSWIVEENL